MARKIDILLGMVVGVLVGWGVEVAGGQNTYQPGLVPNAKQQFTDANGAPLAGGKVYFYQPGTLTPSPTYQDPNDTVLNSNPVLLDSAGRAIVWGTGQYRQIVRDRFGNLVWDQTTSQINLATSGCPGGSYGQFQFFIQNGPSPTCAGASALTSYDQGESVSLNAIQPVVQGVGSVEIDAGTTGSDSISLNAGAGTGGGAGADVVFFGGADVEGGNVEITAGGGDTSTDSGQVIISSENQITDSTSCTEINQDGNGTPPNPSSNISITAGNGNTGCAAPGAGTIFLDGQVQFQNGFAASAQFVDNPAANSTVAISQTVGQMEIAGSSTINGLTIQLPTCGTEYDGKTIYWSSDVELTSVTVTAFAGSINGAPFSGTIDNYGGQSWICRASNTTWYQTSFTHSAP